MESINIILGYSNLFCAILFISLSLPLKYGKIKMNKLYGVKIPKAYDSDEYWYKINLYGAKRIILWSIPLFIIGVISFFINFYDNIFVILFFSIAPIIIIIPLFEVIYYSKKLD